MSEGREVGRISRRAFVARAALLASAAGIAPLLAACGGTPATATTGPAATATTAPPAATATGATAGGGVTPTAAASKAASVAASPAARATSGAAASPATAAGVPGGMVRCTLGAEPSSLDPHKGNTLFDLDVRVALFNALTDSGINGGPEGLAESTDSADAQTWTFKLRQGATFHDGSPVTAEAVKAALERAAAPATASPYRAQAAQIASIATPDPRIVVCALKAPNAAFPNDINDVKIVPPNFDPTKPVGTGPFQFVEWVRNQHVRLKKFPGYFHQGLPYLDELTFLPTPDENQKMVLLQTGQAEFSDTVPLPRVQEARQGGKIQVFGVETGVSPATYFLMMKCDAPPLNDAKVRQAVSYAIDRKGLLDATFGIGTVKSNAIPPKHWAFDPNARSYNDRDVDKAKQLLADAGHAGGGFTLDLKHITSRAEYATIAQLIQANLADIGVKVTIQPLEINVFTDVVQTKRDFNLGLTGILPQDDPSAIFNLIYSTTRTTGKAMGWDSAQFEQLLQQGVAVVDQEARKQVYFKVQELVQEVVPGAIINERPILSGAVPAVQGFTQNVRQITDFSTVWLKK